MTARTQWPQRWAWLPTFAIVLALSVFLSPRVLRAQSAANSGQIVGQVDDPSSSTVADVEVVVRNKDTNFTRTTTTDDEGRYAFSNLPLGPYEVGVKRAGF